ncbi:MAG: alkaline phosphatase family protein [Thermoanaerobaculia bacterium]|nr:alkaline phosphatase family protein [Thermoanaerobaculia bacterium]
MTRRLRLGWFLLPIMVFVGCGQPSPRVIFLGLDGADWQQLDPYLAAGKMPELARLVAEGRAGVLESQEPPLSPLLWTTMMTGVSPLEHGILDFTRRDPATGALAPISSADRRVPAVWNIASSAGKQVGVFGLWATWPPEPVTGLVVSDRFLAPGSAARPPAPGFAHPASAEPWAREILTAVDRDTGEAALRGYLPWLSAADYAAARAVAKPYAEPVSALREILVQTRTYHRLASEWVARERPDLAIVYFEGTDSLGHVFAPYAPPRRPEISAADFDRFSGVPEHYFQELDGLLGDWRRVAEELGATLLIASDHGFHWGDGRPEALSSAAAATAASWHRREGIFLAWGPGSTAVPARGRGSIDQVAATLLALLGLPPGQGLAAPPLAEVAAVSDAPVDYRVGFTPIAYPAAEESTDAATAEVERLRALGYLGSAEGAGRGDGTARTAGSYNHEGLLLARQGDARAAARAYRQALAVDPKHVSSRFNLAELLFREGLEPETADSLLVEAFADGLPEGAQRLRERALVLASRGDRPRALALLDRGLGARPGEPLLALQRGRYRLEAGDCRAAAGDFEAAVAGAPNDPLAFASLGLARLCLGDPAGARRALEKSLELDPDQSEVRAALR